MTAPNAAEKCGPFRAVMNFFSSFALNVVILIFLLYLTWIGTLAQVQLGLHEAQKTYFDSYVWWQQLGPVSLPMPGANLLLWLLFANLVCGGIIRLRVRRRTIGVLIAHVGILLLLAAGFVKFHNSDEGYIRIYEGQEASEFVSYREWELAIGRETADGRIEEFILPQHHFLDFQDGDQATISSPELPFDVNLRGFVRNALPTPAQASPGVLDPVVDGFFLKKRPLNPESELNMAGAYVEVKPRDGGDQQAGIVWGGDLHPLVAVIGGVEYTIDLRKKRYPLDWSVRLEKFTKTDYPGTDKPQDFRSLVTRVAGDDEQTATIKMNEPMRYQGYILYQSRWAPPDQRSKGRFYTVLAVVRNPSDQWPLIAMLVIAAGLLLQFTMKLFAFVGSQKKASST